MSATTRARLGATNHGLGVVEHLGHGDADRAVVAEHDLAQRVADQQHRDPGLVEDPGRGIVVGGEHGDALALGVEPGDRGDGQAGGVLGRGCLAHAAGSGVGGNRLGRPIGHGGRSPVVPRRAPGAVPRESRRMRMRSRSSSATSRLESIGSSSGARLGVVDRHPVRVRAESRAGLRHVVGDEHVHALGPRPSRRRARSSRSRPRTRRGSGAAPPRPDCRS